MKMKKLLILLCCVMIASMGIVLTGCGSSSDESGSANAEGGTDTNPEDQYLGTWEATVFTSSDGEVIYDFKADNEICTYTFNDDHTFEMLLDGEDYDGIWELTEDGMMLTDTDDVRTNMYYKDGELLWTLKVGDMEGSYHFVKK
ncbi:MAG: hypothetical protein Q4C14_08400 [Bacillota bacterium]|nr:hypothetical protein [Bacillota bacterium]